MPDNVRVDSSSGQVYVGYSNGLAVLDPTATQLVRRIQLPAHPEAFELSSTGPEIYVNVPGASEVAVVDRHTGKTLTAWPLGAAKRNFAMTLDEANQRLLVATRQPAMLLVFDTGSGKRTAEMPLCSDADDLFVDRERKHVLAICGEGVVEVLRRVDADHHEVVQRRARARGCWCQPCRCSSSPYPLGAALPHTCSAIECSRSRSSCRCPCDSRVRHRPSTDGPSFDPETIIGCSSIGRILSGTSSDKHGVGIPAIDSSDQKVPQDSPTGSAAEVLVAFLKLGLTSFGGPVAHLGYFRAEIVQRRRWLDDRSYTDLVALCQFLPGPASSQVGMALGMARAGWLGALAAWCAFTLPSAVALIVFAYGITRWSGVASSGAVHGLKVAAVAVVAQALWGMAKNLCPDRARAAMAIVAALLVLLLPSTVSQVLAIALAGLVGWRVLKLPHQQAVVHQRFGVSRSAGAVALMLFMALLIALPVLALATHSSRWSIVAGIYRAGALVFGGGHVVLPLLQATVVPAGVVTNEQFLAGYGAAQAVPGPLFSFAAYLGAVMHSPLSGWTGGLALVVAIFLPAFLLVFGALPFWDTLRQRDGVQSAMAGVNAAVVGILLAALYDPVWTSAIRDRADFAVALAAFALLVYAQISPLLVVLLAAGAGWVFLG